MTTWINKDKFKEENFSKEGFTDNIFLNTNPVMNPVTNPLEIFLKANPLKSIFDKEPTDSRNVKEPYDNIKPLGSPNNAMKNAKKNANENLTNSQMQDDANRIHSIMVSLFSLFISLYVSYNWYFNFTEGFSKRIQFHENFDFVNYLYFFTEYFYKIIRFFDISISVKIPDLVKDFFMKRFFFILIFMNSYFIVKYAILFLSGVYKYAKDVIAGKKNINILNYFYIPQETGKKKKKSAKKPTGLSIYMPLIFSYYVIEGIISSLKQGIENIVSSKVNDAVNLGPSDPSNAFKDSMLSFKVAHPIVYLIIFIIRIAIIYGPTISFASFFIFMYFNFYSLFGIFYYYKINKDPIDEANIYHGTRDGSFIDMFRHIHAVMNVNHIFTEIKEEPKGFEWLYNKLESFLRIIFNNLPFIILFYGLFNSIPSILKIYSPLYKWTGISIISIISLVLFKFMIDENPKYYVMQQVIKNKIESIIKKISNIMQEKTESDDATESVDATESNATESNATESNATESNATESNATESESNATESGDATESESNATESGDATESNATESNATESGNVIESNATESGDATESDATNPPPQN